MLSCNGLGKLRLLWSIFTQYNTTEVGSENKIFIDKIFMQCSLIHIYTRSYLYAWFLVADCPAMASFLYVDITNRNPNANKLSWAIN